MITAAIANPAFNPFDTDVDVTAHLACTHHRREGHTLIHADRKGLRDPEPGQTDPSPGPSGRVPRNRIEVCIGVDAGDEVPVLDLEPLLETHGGCCLVPPKSMDGKGPSF